MKKEEGFLLLVSAAFLIFFIGTVNSGPITGQTVTGSIITGNATSATASLSIIVTGPPTLLLTYPENSTYFAGNDLPLNFTALSADYVLYRIDNGTNTTINSNTTFNVTQGIHTLYLYANNTNGNSIVSVTFTVNSSKFIVYYSNYSGSERGSSTNFNKLSYKDLQNLSNVVLENTNYGKIAFNQTINITRGINLSDNAVSLDNYTSISSDSISVNSTALPNFNTSATLYLYNLTFSNPVILRDGSICPATICTKQSYLDGTLIFNVTGFSTYSAEETPSGGTPTITSSGGGGGGGYAPLSFTLSSDHLSIKLNQGEIKEASLVIKNTGTSPLTINLGQDKLVDFIKIDNSSFSLNPGESKNISFDFLATESTVPNIYLGNIIITAGVISKEVIVAVDIESKQSLFDVQATIPNGYKTISPGNDIIADIALYNLGETGRIDANMNCIIEDSNGKVITNSSSTVAVETQASFTQVIKIPRGTPDGQYVLYVRVSYSGKIASSSVLFNVAASAVSQQEKIYIIVIIILSIALSAAIYYAITRRERHKKKTGKKIEEKVDLKDLLKK